MSKRRETALHIAALSWACAVCGAMTGPTESPDECWLCGAGEFLEFRQVCLHKVVVLDRNARDVYCAACGFSTTM